MYVGGCFDKYISAATCPPQIKIPSSTPAFHIYCEVNRVADELAKGEACRKADFLNMLHAQFLYMITTYGRLVHHNVLLM